MHELHEEEEEDMYNEVKLKSNEAVAKLDLSSAMLTSWEVSPTRREPSCTCPPYEFTLQ